MIILADSDIIRKLAYCGFLLDFAQLWDIPPNMVYVLPALRSQLRNKFANFPEAQKDFDDFLKKASVIPPASVEKLALFEAIDVGEQQIFALMMDDPRVTEIVTGDKKALKRVGQMCFANEDIKGRLEGTKLWCFESIILRMIEKRGISIVRARLQRWRSKVSADEIDVAVFNAIPAGCEQNTAVSELESLIGKVRIGSGGLLIQPA